MTSNDSPRHVPQRAEPISSRSDVADTTTSVPMIVVALTLTILAAVRDARDAIHDLITV
jgi:hypothetical protein